MNNIAIASEPCHANCDKWTVYLDVLIHRNDVYIKRWTNWFRTVNLIVLDRYSSFKCLLLLSKVNNNLVSVCIWSEHDYIIEWKQVWNLLFLWISIKFTICFNFRWGIRFCPAIMLNLHLKVGVKKYLTFIQVSNGWSFCSWYVSWTTMWCSCMN